LCEACERLSCVAGSKDIPVGTAVAWLVEEADELAAFKDITPGGGNVTKYLHMLATCLHALLQFIRNLERP